MRRISFAQWLAVVGVWGPMFVLALLLVLMFAITVFGQIPDRLATLPFLVFGVAFAAAHALVFSGIVGVALLVFRRTVDPKLTLVSAVVGLLLGTPVLAAIYLTPL